MEDDIDFVVPNETVNNAIDKFTREKIDEGWTPDEGSDMNRCVSLFIFKWLHSLLRA